MKQKIILPVCLLFFVLPGFSQSVDYGLTLGANLTNINGNGIKDSYNAGLVGGGFARIDLNNKWNLQPEIVYNYVNAKKADNFIDYYNVDGYPEADEQIRLSYITVPLLLGYKVNKLFTINAGPQYSFLVYDDENLLIASKAAAFKRNDFGISVGGQLNLENVRFFAGYVYGIANVNNIDSRYKWYSRQILIGMNFNLYSTGK